MQSFKDFLTEATSKSAALAALAQRAKNHVGDDLPVDRIFVQTPHVLKLGATGKNRPPTWDDYHTWRRNGGKSRTASLSPKLFHPTQTTVSVSRIASIIQSYGTWYNDEDITVIVRDGKHFLIDGHHRSSAALCMQINVQVDLVVF